MGQPFNFAPTEYPSPSNGSNVLKNIYINKVIYKEEFEKYQ